MSTPLVIFVTLAYVWTAFDQAAFKHDPGMGLMFLSYAIANVGLLWHLGVFSR